MTENEEILTAFRLFAPEYQSKTDEFILARIELYKDFCSKKFFGLYYERAIALLIAHFLTLESLVENSNEGISGAAGGFITGAGIKSEKEGDLAREYGDVEISSSADNPDALFDKTLYGKQFLQLRSMCIIPATIRKGFGFHAR